MNRPLSVGAALLTGLCWVQLPILFFFVGPLCVLALYNGSSVVAGRIVWLIFVCLGFGFVLGWVWWHLTVPKWRAWTYDHVADIPRLRRWAVAIGLTWPDGCLIVLSQGQPRAPAPEARVEPGKQAQQS